MAEEDEGDAAPLPPEEEEVDDEEGDVFLDADCVEETASQASFVSRFSFTSTTAPSTPSSSPPTPTGRPAVYTGNSTLRKSDAVPLVATSASNAKPRPLRPFTIISAMHLLTLLCKNPRRIVVLHLRRGGRGLRGTSPSTRGGAAPHRHDGYSLEFFEGFELHH